MFFFLSDVSNYCENRKMKPLIKISRNLDGNFLDFWQFFKQLFGIPVNNFPAFYEHNRERPTWDSLD